MVKSISLASLSPLLFLLIAFATYWIYQVGFLTRLMDFVSPLYLVPEFIAGMMYTSFIFAPISVGALFVLARYNDPFVVALVAGAGAMCADLIILKLFRFLVFGKSSPISKNTLLHQIIKSLRGLKLFRTLAPIIGAIVIASPLPDELGLMMLGLSKISTFQASLITYVLNTVGILVIALTAHNLP
jgi:hypothetical protein